MAETILEHNEISLIQKPGFLNLFSVELHLPQLENIVISYQGFVKEGIVPAHSHPEMEVFAATSEKAGYGYGINTIMGNNQLRYVSPNSVHGGQGSGTWLSAKFIPSVSTEKHFQSLQDPNTNYIKLPNAGRDRIYLVKSGTLGLPADITPNEVLTIATPQSVIINPTENLARLAIRGGIQGVYVAHWKQ